MNYYFSFNRFFFLLEKKFLEFKFYNIRKINNIYPEPYLIFTFVSTRIRRIISILSIRNRKINKYETSSFFSKKITKYRYWRKKEKNLSTIWKYILMFTVYIHFSRYTDRSPFERKRDVNFPIRREDERKENNTRWLEIFPSTFIFLCFIKCKLYTRTIEL